MMATEPRRAPYGPPATLLQVIDHYRKRDVPAQLTKTDLLQIAVPEGLITRTWAGLRYLNLIEEDGATTDNFRALRFATDEDYQSVLLGILRQAYANIFSVIDPATATEAQLDRAFIPYTPGAQRGRMITLFLGLCRAAGIAVASAPKQRPTQLQSGVRERSAPKPTKRQPAPAKTRSTGRAQRGAPANDAALVMWFNARPEVGTVWPTTERQRWNKTLLAIIEGLYPENNQQLFDRVVDESSESDEENEQGGGE